MFICQELNEIYFFYLVGIEVFLKLFHLMCHLFKSDKKIKQDTASKVFRQSPCMSVLYCVNLEQLYLKDMLAFVVYLK
jgi:hypothetical protein